MFRAIILPIFKNIRLCVTVCDIMHPRCSRPPAGSIVGDYTTNCNTQSSAPEDGQNNCPKHVELNGIINKPLLLHLETAVAQWLRFCATNRNVAGSIPDGVIEIFH